MADVNANIGVNIDSSQALAQLKALQRQISEFHNSVAKSSEAAALAQKSLQKNLVSSINSIGAFSAELRTVNTTAESFTKALENNKLSMREYFRYAGAATKTFGNNFRSELDTIGKVAEERVKTLQTQYIKMGRDANGAMKAIAVRPLVLDMNDLATKTQIAAQKQAIFNQLMKQGSTNLLNFGKNTQWAGRQLMVGFTLPLAAFGSTAAKAFQQLETEVIKFKKVYGDLGTSKSQTDEALNNIKSLADGYIKYGVEVSKTVGLASQAAAAGFQGADLMAQTDAATKLSILGQIDQQQALETTISLQNAFKISSTELASTIDFLNAVENQTVTSLDDITTAIPKVAPVIQQLGGNVKDLAFFLTAMKEGGVNASEGANALKSGLASLINPSSKATAMLGSMGINIDNIVTKNKGNLKATVIEFAKALDTLDPLARARAIETMFGKFQFARISTLLDNVTRQGNQASRVLDLAGQSTSELAGLTSKELGITAESALVKFQASMANLKASIAPVGEVFMKAFVPVVDFISKLLDKFNGLSDGTKKFIAITAGVIGGLGPILLMTFGLLANGLANIMKLFMTLRTGFQRLTGQSQNLGEQTQYLTVEQLNAAAAAHSLEQSHARLTQQFSVEAGAVNQLRTAYQNALAAGASFAALNPGMMRTPKKFANGGIVVSGPGGPKDDMIPANLSNGEVVLSVNTVKKNPSIVAGLLSDRKIQLPGYAVNPGSIAGNTPGMKALGKGFKNATMYLPESWNTSMGGSGQGVPTSQVSSYISQGGSAVMAPLMAVMAKQMGISLNSPQFQKEWARIGNQFASAAATALNNSGLQFIKDEHLEEIVVPALKETSKKLNIVGREVSTSLDKAITEIHTVGQVGTQSGAKGGAGRTALSRFSYRNIRENAQQFAMQQMPSMFARNTRTSSSGKIKNTFQTLNPATQQWEVATMAHITKSITTTVQDLIKRTTPYLGDMGAKITKATSKSMVDGAKEALKIQSPSEETKQIGIQAGVGLKNGIEESIKNVKSIGKTAGTNIIDSVNTGITSEIIRSKPQIRQKVRGLFSGGIMGGMSTIGSKLSSPKVGFGVSSALMAGSMLPGATGQISNTLSQIGFFGQAVMMLPGPLKLAAAAAGGLYVAHKLMAAAAEKARLKIEGLGDIANLTGDKLKGLDNYFGITPTISPFEQAGTAKPISQTERSEIQKLRESDTFKKDFKPEIETLKKSTDQEATAALNALSIKLAGRGYAKEQIQTFLNALQQEAGKTSLDLKFETIDLTAKGGEAGFKKNINNTIAMLKKSLDEGMSTIQVDTGVRVFDPKSGMGRDILKTVAVFTDEAKKKVNLASQSMTAMITGLSGQLANGKINAQQFANAFGNISAAIEKMPKAEGLLMVDYLMRSLPENLRQTARGIDDVNSQMLILQAQALGMTNLPGLIEALNIAANGYGPDQALAKQRIDQFKKEMASRTKLITDLAKTTGSITGTGTGTGTDVLSKEAKLTIARLQKELDALETKRDIIKDTNDELKRQYDYQEKLMQFSQSEAQAKMAGNYIEAAAIRQQKNYANVEYNQETQRIAQDKIIATLRNRISALQAGEKVTAAEKARNKAAGKANGGFISGPGTGTSDSISAMLSNGEYVIQSSAVNKYGKPFFDSLNAQKFATGGMVQGHKNGGMPNIMGMGLDWLGKTLFKSGNSVIKNLLGFDVTTPINKKSNMELLSMATLPVGVGGRSVKAGAALSKGVAAGVTKESDILKYFMIRGSDGDISVVDQVIATTVKGNKKDVKGMSLLEHDPMGISTLISLFSKTGPRSTKDMLGLSLMLGAGQSGITKTGIALAASADRSIYSEALVKGLERRGLGNVIGLPERNISPSLGNTSVKALSERDKILKNISNDEEYLAQAFEIPELALNTSREALSGLLKNGYDYAEFKKLLTTFNKSMKTQKGFAMGGMVDIPKFHNWNGVVPGPYGQELNAVLKSGTEGVYQNQYIAGLKQAATGNTSTSNASSVYNIDMTINGGGANANEIADQVMRKIKLVADKNNKTNKVAF